MRNMSIILMILLILCLTLLFNYQIDTLRKIIIRQNQIIGGQSRCLDNLQSGMNDLLINLDVITGKLIWTLEW